eukprot:TRINITY_DN4998_c0_g1_i2.p1 TRINITY_DN4998_c0_g1~~TRINITY_DN4998_c0_g1_i2.p1  ORF type:complete len:334 (-),score=79.11 TRINITY_DN4998_c0_g1_i2:32-883(-)
MREAEEERMSLEKKVEESFKKIGTQINLNVGGQRFSTSRDTLVSIEGTYFYAMLSSDRWQPNAQGEYFIDRSSKHFLQILDFMRTGKLVLEDLTENQKNELKIELDYYQIPSEVQQQHVVPKSNSDYEEWQWDPIHKGTWIILSHNNKVASGEIHKTSAVAGNKPLERFRARIFPNNGTSWSGRIGMIESNNINFDDWVSWGKYGWFLNLGNGDTIAKGESTQSGVPVEDGDIVEFYHDRIEDTLTISVNSEAKYIFKNIPSNASLYPCFDRNRSCAHVEIMD